MYLNLKIHYGKCNILLIGCASNIEGKRGSKIATIFKDGAGEYFFPGAISLGQLNVHFHKIVINLPLNYTSFTVKENHINLKG